MEMPKAEIGKYLGITAGPVWLLARHGKELVDKKGVTWII
jgi:hypothetical protein